jgi:hypothetical protein
MLIYLSNPTPAAQVPVLPGQMVLLKLRDVLTTEKVMKGDTIGFEVADDVVVAGHVVIHKGDPATGKIVAVRGQGKRNAKDAAVIFQFVSLRSVDGQVVQLRKNPDKPKRVDSKENEIEANELLPGYTGRVIGAEKGKEYPAYVDASVTVSVPDTVVAPPAAPAVAAPPASAPSAAAAPSVSPAVTNAPTPAAPEEPALVDFNSDPPGADILIDGNLVGNTPAKLSVAAGRHSILLRIGGYNPWTRTMVVEPGSYPSIRATLEKQ